MGYTSARALTVRQNQNNCEMLLYHKASHYAGYLVILTFCIFSYTSFLFHPGPYNPFYNNLSQLGNYYLNPNGALFFNMGMILSGTLVLLFYHQLSKKTTRIRETNSEHWGF